MRALTLLLLTGCYLNHGSMPDDDGANGGDNGGNGTDNGGSGGDNGGIGGDNGGTGGDNGGDIPPAGEVNYTIESTRTGTIENLAAPGAAQVGWANNQAYVLDEANGGNEFGRTFRYLMETYTSPTDTSYCVEGNVDETGTCRGTSWSSGRITLDKPTKDFCMDQEGGRMFLVKDGGTRIELVDIAMEGERPYTFNTSFDRINLSSDVTGMGQFLGPCVWLSATDELVLTATSDATDFVVVEASNPDGPLIRSGDQGLNPRHAAALSDGTAFVVDDATSDSSLYRIDAASLEVTASWTTGSPIVRFGYNTDTGEAWLAHGAGGAGYLDTEDPGATEKLLAVPGNVQWAWPDLSHGVTWFVTEDDGWKAVMVQGGDVVDTYDFGDREVISVAEPGDMGDLVVYFAAEGGGTPFEVLGAKGDRSDGRPPLYIYLFTTIEEPSDTNLTLPCAGDGGFEKEIKLVYSNATRLASLGVPIAMAITDNFGEKVEICSGQIPASGDRPSVDDIYSWLQDTAGFELGAMLHNRPCYHCSSSDGTADADGYTSNPDWCPSSDPNYIAPTSGAACFPDDPEYCELGDWECYYAFLQPRLEFADKGIPGGAKFVVGADRHGMWKHDWLRFYQEVERERWGLTGFDVTMFAGTWAYNNISYDDPRGKNPTPWRPQDRVAAWRPGDVDNWAEDSAYSSVLYLPGINSAMVKLAEQQKSGLYMADFFDTNPSTEYYYDDYDMSWQFLRQAVNYRRPDAVNTWYFHIHDNGLVNLGDASNNDVQIVDDDGVTYTPMMPLEEFVARINERYVSTGEVVWMGPTEIKTHFVDW